MTKLVIVESPAKARTIGGYLGAGYAVEASIGHIRDLPQPSELPADMKKGPFGKFSVDVDNGFEPYYVVDSDKKKIVAELRRLLKSSDELLLATDEDREGEAIAWHLYEVLKPKVPVKRMAFHEITPEAIARALDNPRQIDMKLVDAQESRRILDRLVGYEVSPLLWRKVAPGLSAGRVQSVATRLVVQRERERMAFQAASYWDVTATFVKGAEGFDAKLVSVDGTRIATGKDFDDRGALVKKDARALGQAEAEAIAGAVADAAATVASVESKPYTRRPAPPFTTSTLQQEASRKLRMGARDAMRTAQALYENGYITYMRTDSTNLSDQAVEAARTQIGEIFGEDYLPAKPRLYSTTSKGAQEAHEAIRPAGDHFRTPATVKSSLNDRQFALYELIWKRTVASQMADARGRTASVRVDVPVGGAAGAAAVQFAASGTIITFPGFMAAYQESRDAKRYEDGSQDARLPDLERDEGLGVSQADADGHETQPPPRYTEASLVKKMEDLGIGRPSTYATTIATIGDRGYVDHRGQALVPTWTAFSVVRLLEENLPELVDFDFTAAMETELDRIVPILAGRRAADGAGGPGRQPGGHRRQSRQLDRPGGGDRPAGRPLRTVPPGGRRRRTAQRLGSRLPGPRRADARQGEGASGSQQLRRPRARRRPRDRAQGSGEGRPFRALRHRRRPGGRGGVDPDGPPVEEAAQTADRLTAVVHEP